MLGEADWFMGRGDSCLIIISANIGSDQPPEEKNKPGNQKPMSMSLCKDRGQEG